MPHTNTPQKLITLAILTLSFSLSLLAIPSSHLTASANYRTKDILPLETKCPELLKKLPYAYDQNANKYYQFNTSDKKFEENPKLNPTNPQYFFKKPLNIKTLDKECNCELYIFDKRNFGSETEPMTRHAWANAHLKDVCSFLQISESTKSGNVTTFKTCAFNPVLTKDITLSQLKATDTEDNNCKINTKKEKCLYKKFKAQNQCSSLALTFNVDGFTGNCEEIKQYHCINNTTPEKLDFNDGASESNLDTSKYLLKEDQDGFVKFFKDNNQGAGDQNPAINLILYVINLLAGLSFLIAVGMLILGGFYLVMASGNSEMTDRGKKAIQNFIYAITFTLLSYAIVTFIQILLYS